LLSGVTALEDIRNFGFRPDLIMPTIGHIISDEFTHGYAHSKAAL
jgi:hypothetical protein